NLLAELDRENPGWRIESLEARREQIPDNENGALVILRVESKLPADWSDRPGIRKVHWHDHLIWPPAMRLPAEEAAELAEAYADLEELVDEARQLATMRRGRFPFTIPTKPRDGEANSLPPRSIAVLLRGDAVRLTQEDSVNEAFEGAVAMQRAL